MVHIQSVSGLTQSRPLGEAETVAKELISATEDVRVGDVDVDVRIEVGAVEVSAWSGKIHEDREAARALEHKATEEAEELTRTLSDLAVPLRDIGTVLGVSHQRASARKRLRCPLLTILGSYWMRATCLRARVPVMGSSEKRL